ncbi:MAG: helix-turn-helix domain containing protein [Bacteroidetes bacterium]|nr:helix-turn-helix domain containing protein [Bacteroidota bacterium]
MSDTKEYIIDQAYKLFLDKSYEAVSISDISKAIGFTKGALYHHFINKEELFKAVIDKYLNVISLRDIKEDITLAEFIEFNISYVTRIVNTVCIDDLPFVPVNYLSLMIDALRHYPGYAEKEERFFTREIDKLDVILKRAVKNGEIREDIDTYLIAQNFFSITVGIAADMFRQNSPEQAIAAFKDQMYQLYKLLKR